MCFILIRDVNCNPISVNLMGYLRLLLCRITGETIYFTMKPDNCSQIWCTTTVHFSYLIECGFCDEIQRKYTHLQIDYK